MRLPAPRADVVYRAIDGGAVLLATEQEVYFGLNEVGSYIWEHLPPVCQTLAELTAALAGAYPDVADETLRADARELLDELRAAQLVAPRTEVEDAPQAAATQELD